MVVTFFLAFMAGKFLDDWLGTSPWLLIVFIIIGAAASIRSLYVLVMRSFGDFK